MERKRIKLLLLVCFLVFLVLSALGAYYLRQRSLPRVQPIEMETVINLDIYDLPGGKKLGYFLPGQRFFLTGRKSGEWVETKEKLGGFVSWVKEDGPYQKVEE